MRALRNILLAAGLLGGAVLGGASPAAAHTPSGSAPNYNHFDADGVLAAQTGASVSGTLYWDSNSQAHYLLTFKDPLPGNGRPAILEILYLSDGQWRLYDTWTTSSSGTWTQSISWPGHRIQALNFRVAQRDDPAYRWASDVNSYGGA